MTSELLKVATSAKGIAYLFVAWGVPLAISTLAWLLVAMDDWQTILPDEVSAAVAATGLSGPWLFLIAWSLLTLFFGLNSRWFFRMFEGYPFPAWLRDRRQRIHWLRRECERTQERIDNAARRALSTPPAGIPTAAELAQELSDKRAELISALGPWGRVMDRLPWRLQSNWRDMPRSLSQTMPTIFGNRIRAFERYPTARWNLDIIVLWYEFIDVAEDRVAESIDSARQGVEIAIGATVSSIILAAGAGGPLFWRATWNTVPSGLLCLLVVALVAAYLSYRKAVEATAEWAASVRALVNNHRGDVAAALGFKLPRTLKEEQEFWRAVTGFVRTGGDAWAALLDKHERREAIHPTPGQNTL